MAEKIWADGMRFENPREGAPEWIKGKISIKSENFIAFLKKYTNETGWVNLDVKQGKGGALYVELNTWKKDQKVATEALEPQNNGEIQAGDTPF